MVALYGEWHCGIFMEQCFRRAASGPEGEGGWEHRLQLGAASSCSTWGPFLQASTWNQLERLPKGYPQDQKDIQEV